MSNILKLESSIQGNESLHDVDNIIDIDRVYSKEFSEYLHENALANPLLRGHSTLLLAAEFLIYSFHQTMPSMPLTLCNSDGFVLLVTDHKEKIGQVCYLAFCKKIAFMSALRQGRHVCTKIIGDRLLGGEDNGYIYVFSYPIFDRTGTFSGYLTGATSDDEQFTECGQAVALMARLISNQYAVLEQQVAERSTIMSNVSGCGLIMGREGTILEHNDSFGSFLTQNGIGSDGLNLFQLAADREHLSSILENDEKSEPTVRGSITEFKLQLPAGAGMVQCSLTQCEPLSSADGANRHFVCFDILRYLAVSREKTAQVSPMAQYFGHLISKYQNFNEVLEECQQLATKKINVLIQGESGTGKGVLARAIHEASMVTGPFVSMNCGAIAPNLLVSELFGYEEGAFTGASRTGKMGKMEFANKGTLFLDEIGEMPLESQVSLLTFLDHQIVVRVGGSKQRPVNVRIIAATNRNLAEEVQKGNFREDLFYRLNVLGVHMPALRERREDLPVISRNILDELAREQRTGVFTLDSSCLWLLKQYEWPGNIRELRNTLELASALAPDSTISLPLLQRVMDRKCFSGERAAKVPVLNEQERLQICLEKNAWKITAAAAELKISRTTLYKKMDQYHLQPSASV